MEEKKEVQNTVQTADIAQADQAVNPVQAVIETERQASAAQSEQDAQAATRNKFATEKKKRKKMPKWLKASLWIIILAAIGTGIYFLVNKLTKKEELPPEIAPVTRGQLASNVSGYGTVVPKEKSEYGAKTRGKVTDVYVAAGDLVKPGDKLFTIDPSELIKELDAANATKKTAQDRLKTATQDLQNTNIIVPFNGKLIESKTYKKGDKINSGDKVGTLVDDTVMKLELYFSHAYIDHITVGQAAAVSVPQSMTSVTGMVSQVDKIKKVSPDGSILFRVYVNIPNPGTLTKDAVATASITTDIGEAFPAEGGKLAYVNSQEITAKLTGDVASANIIDYGEYRAGQSLVTISEDGLYEALNTAQKAYDEAAKNVDEIMQSIQNTDIIADIEGMVSGVMVAVGDELKASGTPVLTVSNTTSLYVEVNIDELDIGKLQVGMPATIIQNNGTDAKEWTGTLSYLSFEAKKGQEGGYGGGGAVAYFPAKIEINNDGNLLPNMGVDFKITSMVKEDCLLVPSGAIVYSESGTVVYVQNEALTGQETIVQVPADKLPKGFTAVSVEIGLADDTNTEIISGLTEGLMVASRTINQDGGMMGGGGIMIG